MKILLNQASAEIVVKGSRFIARLCPVASQADARETLRAVKKEYAGATHVVHAFITGLNAQVCGSSDDGEPQGTAGRPVLEALKGSGITNALLTVTRYFGGTLLGTGGLARAYTDAAKSAIAACRTEEYCAKETFCIECAYDEHKDIRRALENAQARNVSEDFSAAVRITGEIKQEIKAELTNTIKNITKGRIQCI